MEDNSTEVEDVIETSQNLQKKKKKKIESFDSLSQARNTLCTHAWDLL